MTITYTLNQLPEAAATLLKNCNTKKLLFYGAMGVGKTTLIKAICKQLGVTDTISSPTFSLVNEYQGTQNLIYHFDFYRIEGQEEVYQIGFEEYLDQDAWVFIEWPEKIPNLLPEEAVHIEISFDSQNQRTLHLIT